MRVLSYRNALNSAGLDPVQRLKARRKLVVSLKSSAADPLRQGAEHGPVLGERGIDVAGCQVQGTGEEATFSDDDLAAIERLSVSGGTSPYTYSWSNAALNSSKVRE